LVVTGEFEIVKNKINVLRIKKEQSFGEEDAMQITLFKKIKYSSTVKCVSKTGSVLMIKVQDFLKNFKDNKESFKEIQLMIEEKIKQQLKQGKLNYEIQRKLSATNLRQ
jgi:CRP-like cAMP-binding protein